MPVYSCYLYTVYIYITHLSFIWIVWSNSFIMQIKAVKEKENGVEMLISPGTNKCCKIVCVWLGWRKWEYCPLTFVKPVCIFYFFLHSVTKLLSSSFSVAVPEMCQLFPSFTTCETEMKNTQIWLCGTVPLKLIKWGQNRNKICAQEWIWQTNENNFNIKRCKFVLGKMEFKSKT